MVLVMVMVLVLGGVDRVLVELVDNVEFWNGNLMEFWFGVVWCGVVRCGVNSVI